jgi:hypothetical protein
MAILPASLDYTDKDFASLRARFFALIASVFPTWTDANVASFGTILLELYAFVGDNMTFYQDNQARESRLLTATQRKNVINIAKMLGYAAQGAQAAQASEVIALAGPPAADFTLPAGTIITTANITSPVPFQTLADVTIAAGQNPPTATVTVENSAFAEDDFTSTGLPDQAFVLSQIPYLAGGTTVTAADGAYTLVDNFLDSGPTDRHCTVGLDQNSKATLTFGDGIMGTVPSAAISTRYKTGGGLAGNVDPGAIKNVQGSFTDNDGNPVTVSATNPLAAQGGLAAQTVAQIQVAAPASLAALTRTVGDSDYETNALRVPGVARALMTTSDNDPSVQENRGILYVVPVGGGTPSPTLLAAVLTSVTVTYPNTITFRVTPQVPVYLPINVFARVYKQKGVLPAQAGFNLRATLATFFVILNPDGTPNERIDFGAKLTDANGNPSPLLSINELIDACEETAGVREIGGAPTDFTLNGAHDDVVLGTTQFPVLGTVTLIDADTGQAM